MSDSTWVLSSSSSPCNKAYRRPLGASELGFFWDGEFAGTGDTLQHVLAEVEDPLEQERLLSEANLSRTWSALKQRFPLLACSVETLGDKGGVEFVLREQDLHIARPSEITVREAASAQEAEDFNESIVNGPRKLSRGLLTRIWILRRTDSRKHFHLLTHIAHVIVDGLSNAIILRDFFSILCEAPHDAIPDMKLEDRLGMMLPMEDRDPNRNLSEARRRWRRAIASAICSIRRERMKGGHTLPRIVTVKTPYTPAYSCARIISLTSEASLRILAGCKKAGVTFGHAFPVLSQVAHCRVLHRLHRQGRISDEEWQFRMRQPMHFEGPLSVRPYLCPKWYTTRGSSEVGVYCANYNTTLPFVPPSYAISRNARQLSFCELLSKECFMKRAGKIKDQMAARMQHPLQHEFNMISHKDRSVSLREVAMIWNETERTKCPANMKLPPAGNEYGNMSGTIIANGGSSMGNLDILFPSRYPLPDSSRQGETKPLIRTTLALNRLRCRPKELYLGAYMTGRQIQLFVFWDGNVYDGDLVNEWLNEAKLAAEWYLGNPVETDYGFEGLMSRL